MPQMGSSISAPLSRNPSSASNASTGTSASITSAGTSDEYNAASHYRRLARADIRREERKEERKRRRGDSSHSSISSVSSRGVPDLIGGHLGGAHSRNASIASTASSSYTVASLSRNPSSASSASSRRYGGGVNVDTVIMEDDDEAEWLTGTPFETQSQNKPYSAPPRKQHGRRQSSTGLSSGRIKELEAFGMGKDMRDVLEEILQMEKEFVLSDTEDQLPSHGDLDVEIQHQHNALFTAKFDRPPRTPSPMEVDKRSSLVPAAPGAPIRGHRMTMSMHHPQPRPAQNSLGGGFIPSGGSQRPGSFMGHQSSLSESHTALYLATASPVKSTGSARRSASPKLEARKSLTFTPDKAGPSINSIPNFGAMFDSPAGSTPVRRRMHSGASSAHHPTMDGWKFPSSGLGSNSATPTKPPPINTSNLPGSFQTPVSNRHKHSGAANQGVQSSGRISPNLLWPATSSNGSISANVFRPPPPLAPALFPSSPAGNSTPGASLHHIALSPESVIPRAGLRIGVLLGSDESPGDMDVDMDNDDEDGSTEHGHGGHRSRGSRTSAYLPVFLEAEGFRVGPNGQRWRV